MYIGLPQWQHPAWHRLGLRDLADYSRYFNCVEGNTTFYALPKQELARRWYDMTHDQFRFCFKFPSQISHKAALHHCEAEINAFYHALTPLHERIGQLWLQLPAAFAPEHLARLWAFFDALPNSFTYGVEVRHPAFFAKGEEERRLNQGLQQRGINRVILDSRALHQAIPHNDALQHAQQKKPKLPVHAILTATHPLVRFIGGDVLKDNLHCFIPWQKKLSSWCQQQQPYLFIHTPDNSDSPQQAKIIWQQLHRGIPDFPTPPDWPEQNTLF